VYTTTSPKVAEYMLQAFSHIYNTETGMPNWATPTLVVIQVSQP